MAVPPCIALAFEQPLHQPPRQHSGDAPPVMAWREGGLHWHDLIAHERVEAPGPPFIERAAAKFLGTGEQHRARIGAGETDAQVGKPVDVAPERDCDAGDRIFDRTADADLVVSRAQSSRVLRAHGGDDFAWAQREEVFAVALRITHRYVLPRKADVELFQWNGAAALRTGDVDLGSECQESGREIAGKGCEAYAAALRCHVADGASSL